MSSGLSFDATRLSAALARWISDQTHAGLFATDTELRIVSWNRWMEIHTRKPAAEVLGQPLLQLYPDLTSRGLDARYRDALTGGRISTLSQALHGYVLSMPATHPDLGLLEMPQTGRIGPLHDGETIIGTVTVIENVSERLANDAELRRQIDAQKTARAAAETALRDKDEFLSTLSHELRTPLNAVLGWARILLSRNESNPDVIARALTVIERNAAAQAAMIDDILDVARIVSGKLRLDMAPVDLAPVVLAAIDVITPSARAKRIAVRTAFADDVPNVLGDQGRLQQVIWNLLSNAVKFSDAGGEISIGLAAAEGGVRLTVSDTGHGIAPEFLPFVFDRFRQSDPSSARRQGGLGLGLALVRDLVQLHGGTIAADNRAEGHGAVFTIHLPALMASTVRSLTEDEMSAGGTAPSLAGLRILVVEDEADARDLITAVLIRFGAHVVEVGSAEAALARLTSRDEKPFAVLISDIGMPQHDGYELIGQVRSLGSPAASIPALAVTGYATDHDRQRALSAGYTAHLRKPIDPSALATAVLRAIQDATIA